MLRRGPSSRPRGLGPQRLEVQRDVVKKFLSDAKVPESECTYSAVSTEIVFKKDDTVSLDARRVVEHSARRYKLAVEYVDVEQEPAEIQERFKFDLPVVIIDGKRRFSGHVSPALLEKILNTRPR